MSSELKIFDSLNCSLCKSPYSRSSNDPKYSCQLWCGKAICGACWEKEKPLKKEERKHQCGFQFFCCNPHKDPSFLRDVLNDPSILESPNGNGWLLSEPITNPLKCSKCDVKYSMWKDENKPGILKCGHTICTKCYLTHRKTVPLFGWFLMKCSICNDSSFYPKSYSIERRDNWLREFLRELPEMIEQIPKVQKIRQELLSSGCFTLDQDLMRYVQTTQSITIPECPVCNEEYSIENSQREPFILQCGHGICNGCFAKMSKTITDTSFKYVLECPQCKQSSWYAQESWENPLKKLSETRQTQLKRTCGDCEKEAPLFEMFQCSDCGKVMFCSVCGMKKHRRHKIVDLEVVEVKELMNATYEVITPQIKAYDVCFPELQTDLIKKIHNFQAKALEKAGKIEGLNYDAAEYEKADCLAIGEEFEGICEKYLGDLRSCNTGIEKLLSKCNESK